MSIACTSVELLLLVPKETIEHTIRQVIGQLVSIPGEPMQIKEDRSKPQSLRELHQQKSQWILAVTKLMLPELRACPDISPPRSLTQMRVPTSLELAMVF